MLPTVDEFGVVIGFDTFSEKDASGAEWQFLNIVCLGSSFQVVALLGDALKIPSASEVLEAYALCWGVWAGGPEVGVIVDRAKDFLGEFAKHMSAAGCTFDSAAKASPWHIAKVERHGDIWQGMWRRVVYSKQVECRDEVLLATIEVDKAKNSMLLSAAVGSWKRHSST